MSYRIRDNLSYCVIGDHAVFLDVEADRYFTLPDNVQRAFLAYADAPGREVVAPVLLASGILAPAGPVEGDVASVRIEPPSRSAQEMPDPKTNLDTMVIAEVMATVWRCRRQLRTKSLKDVLDMAVGYRASRCLPRTGSASAFSEQLLLQAASVFRRLRRYIPVAMCCLPDSLAFSHFLARRGFHSNIVFGVTYDPFAAHCWVQSGDIALNETVGTAMTHTIIRVV